ncbi:MAG: CPBP family intramembrane metalloprotease [Flavobacteriales bacterium]|nr:CPBP family intramembrane metalloprotease [Flavobacteriales bacterium]
MNAFIQKAVNGKNSWKVYLAVILLSFGFFFVGQIPISLILLKAGQNNVLYNEKIAQQVSYPVFFILLNLQFILALGALVLFTYLLHRRPPLSLLTGTNEFRFNRLGWGIISAFVVITLSDIINYTLHPEEYVWQFDAEKFFPFLVVALLIFPIQIGFEEIFFRGYVLQGVSLGTRSIVAGWIVSSVLFGLAHSFNVEVTKFGFFKMLTVYIALGLGLGFVTLYTQGLEVAMGFHLVNNLYVALVKTFPGSSLNTPALFITPAPDVDYMVVESIIGMLIFILLAIFPYKMKQWKQLFLFQNRY